jgi:Patatin-like phospholipase
VSEHYSPERRTALVLSGTGADGAYHAGVLRALSEAGIKVDLVAGRGIGAVAATLVAVDGGSRLWEPNGLWRSRGVAHLYRWRWPVRWLIGMLAALAGVLASPFVFLALAIVAYPLSLIFGMVGLDQGASVMQRYLDLLAGAFAPGALPTWLPRLITVIVIVGLMAILAGSLVAWRRAPLKRRSRGPLAWAVVGAPLDGSAVAQHFVNGLWDLLRGGAPLKTPDAEDLSRRFTELLAENLSQPGFSELLLTVHDLDARRDLVFGLVREPYRRTLFPPPGAVGARRAEAFDLAGLARDHLIDVMRASVSVPGLTEPTLARFAADSYWRGEVHRLIDRPAGLARLLEETAAAGAEQLILVSGSPEPPGPHELSRPRLDPMGRISDHAGAMDAAAVRDALRHVQHRFRAVYAIRPSYNPVGAFDLSGAYDDRSDRHHPLSELMERGYEDAYRDFVEPVVAASGEHLRAPAPEESV